MATNTDEIVTPLDPPDDIKNGIQSNEEIYTTGPKPKLATSSIKTWPISILFIMANEFCERCDFGVVVIMYKFAHSSSF